MDFLSGTKLSDAIHTKLCEDDLKLAVAFWGTGAAERLSGQNAQVICNLASGGTNPRALKTLVERGTLRDETLRQYNALHAKVYIGKKRTIVGSANLSTNGLGLDGIEQAFWEEAGAEMDTSAEIVAWFEALWNKSAPVNDDDLNRVVPIYGFRQKVKPTVLFFDKFDVENATLPFLRKAGQADWKANDEALEKTFGTINDVVRNRLDYGAELTVRADLVRLKGRWMLTWSFKGKQVSDLYWSELSDLVVPGAFFIEGSDEPIDTILGAEVVSPEPFDLNDDRFTTALTATLTDPNFKTFRVDHWEGGKAYYKNQEAQLRAFWTTVQARYKALSG